MRGILQDFIGSYSKKSVISVLFISPGTLTYKKRDLIDRMGMDKGILTAGRSKYWGSNPDLSERIRDKCENTRDERRGEPFPNALFRENPERIRIIYVMQEAVSSLQVQPAIIICKKRLEMSCFLLYFPCCVQHTPVLDRRERVVGRAYLGLLFPSRRSNRNF